MYGAVVHLFDIFLISVMNIFLLRFPIWVSIVASLVIYLGLYSFRVYDKDTMKSYTESLIRTLLGTIIGFVGVLIIYFFLDNFFNRHFFSANLLFTVFLLPILHKVEYNIYEKYLPVRNYIVIGKKENVGHIMDEISQKAMNKMIFVQYINPSPVTLEKLVSEGKSAKEHTAKIHGIVVADPELEKEVKPQIERYKAEGLEIQYLPTIAEKYLKRIPIEVAQKFKEYYDVVFQNVQSSPSQKILDRFASMILLILSSPFMLVIGLCILIEDGKPMVFRQERVGKNGKIFIINKFRSLRQAEINPNNPNEDIEKRVLKIGKVIRKFRLDELPQVFNILKGDMSIVGPRPEMVEFHQLVSNQIPFYNYRLKLNPGITGWAQINYKHTTTLEDYIKKTEYDLYYIKNRTIFLDFQIMLKTLETMIGMRGAR
ncbi:MAG: exopolysaccharide biosynthesis polyprenyl glycosylphosphotransferase [Thermotogaceae bacterium]|nr:exopolysaccharide biosynthesis polyprenyl glycosylphosphotransferase [Thermotogaceae bacterium]